MKLYFVVGIFPEYLLISSKTLEFQGTHSRKFCTRKEPLYHFSTSHPSYGHWYVFGMSQMLKKAHPLDVWVDDLVLACVRAKNHKST